MVGTRGDDMPLTSEERTAIAERVRREFFEDEAKYYDGLSGYELAGAIRQRESILEDMVIDLRIEAEWLSAGA